MNGGGADGAAAAFPTGAQSRSTMSGQTKVRSYPGRVSLSSKITNDS
jgi:hypothetical protein